MTESEAIAKIETVCDLHLKSYDVVRVEASAVQGSRKSYVGKYAIIAKSSMSEQMLIDVLLLGINEGGNIEFETARKEIDDLKSEIMILSVLIEL